MASYQVDARVTIGNGHQALFWEDRWISGFRIFKLGPKVYARVSRHIRRTRIVVDAIQNNTGAGDV